MTNSDSITQSITYLYGKWESTGELKDESGIKKKYRHFYCFNKDNTFSNQSFFEGKLMAESKGKMEKIGHNKIKVCYDYIFIEGIFTDENAKIDKPTCDIMTFDFVKKNKINLVIESDYESPFGIELEKENHTLTKVK